MSEVLQFVFQDFPRGQGHQAMTDIVERLLACDGIKSGDPDCNCQEAAAEIARLKEVVTRLHAEKRGLHAAIRTTASNGTYDEMAIRKAVSFELAELIVEERRALEPKP